MLNHSKQVEIWKPVVGFETLYEVSDLGRISNHRKVLKTYVINSGYECLKFYKDGKIHSFLLHRLVAEAFVDNLQFKPVVNHLDSNKRNNKASNLEWVTTAENLQHAKDSGWMVYNVPTLGLRIGSSSKYHNVCKVKNSYVATIG